MTESKTPVIVDPQGKPARQAIDTACPQCGAGPAKRVLSGGFGAVHDVCGVCGHDFAERTL
jgi:uncharacterized protein (DUF983 family)